MNQHPTPEYFRAPKNCFWQWSEGAVIEWKNGITICFRDDLLSILRSLSNSGVPSLSAVLLALSACNDSWKTSADCTGILHGLLKAIPQKDDDSDDDVIAYHINRAVTFMNIIAQLPADIRKGYRRAHLLQEVFSLSPYQLAGAEIINAIDSYISLLPQNYVYTKPVSYTRSQFITDLRCLTTALEKYPTAQKLEMQLRTGLTTIPLPAPLELPEQKPADLLQELLEEPKTTGISRLAKKIIAALNIPMHLQRSGGQSYGGISDITNRGNFDRLLLSELANDDTMLMTRLVNNEALYLRREEPPHNPKTKRLLLIDSTLKLWGVPRVFAVSAAIACTQNIRHGEAIEAYTLGGTDFTEANLTTKQGVIQSLQQLDPSLHCTIALANCLENISGSNQTDSILITTEETIHEIAFQKWLATSGDTLGFIITVNRNGSLHFHGIINGHLKPLTVAKFDLEELLFRPAAVKHQPKKIDGKIEGLPAFFAEEKPPLLFPAIYLRHKSKAQFNYYHSGIGLFSITEDLRLLYWASQQKGAQELLSCIKKADTYFFVYDKDENISIIVSSYNEKKILMYYIVIPDKTTLQHQIEVPVATNFHKLVLKENKLYVYSKYASNQPFEKNAVAVINCLDGQVIKYASWQNCSAVINAAAANLTNYDNPSMLADMPGSRFGKFVNNGYTVVVRIKKIFIDTAYQLCIDAHHFSIPTKQNNFITLKEGTGPEAKFASRIREEKFLEINPQLWLMQFVWPDGSTATVDSRGLLHLKSSDATLPEVTIILIQGKTTACWASDDTVCGSEYFRESILKMMPADFFYAKYITPIIQHILQS